MIPVQAPGSVRAGRVIAGKYRLDSLLGEGGMGSVWRAYNLQLEVPVALKLLRPDMGNTELGERLRVEARAAAMLAHPSIVRVFDIGESELGEPFIVMELLVGESLASVLDRGPLPPTTALGLLLPIAEALGVAHSHGVVHRDLKPDNIFLAAEGDSLRPKLLDFGIAKLTGEHGTHVPTLTRMGTLLGSPDYMSPEQAHGRSDIDERTDIWSFCVVLFEAIAGRVPFHGANCSDVLCSVVADPTPSLELLADVDPTLVALIEQGLAKDREARPPSILMLGQQLAEWLAQQGVREDATGSSLESKWLGRTRVESTPAIELSLPRPRRHRRGWLPGAAAVTLAALAGLAAAAQQLQFKPPSAPVALEAGQPMPVVAVDALPLEASPPSRPERESPTTSATESDVVLAADPPLPSPHPSVAASPPRTKRPSSTVASLPRAIPARSKRADLLNPY
ncbi:MAG TPA: protein kinase [Polyangiaceae bacterium]|nr:protein kinase [Polyangiaceae bacterium]